MLAVESPLSLLIRRELSGIGPNSWDVGRAQDGLLLEARVTPGTDCMTLVPQLVFDGEARLLYCDGDDISAVGRVEAEDRFYTRLQSAYRHFCIYGPNARKRDHKGQDMLKFLPVKHIRNGFRLPPRICCNQSLAEFGSDAIMFNLRYVEHADRERTLRMLGELDWLKRANDFQVQLGCELPEVHLSYCLTRSCQAITKIGFNLLSFFCKSTPVNRSTFERTVEWIVEGRQSGEFGDAKKFGFIAPAGVADLKCPPKSHMFRLTHDSSRNMWKMYASLFEGTAAAYIAFPGPNNETWGTMDVVARYDRPMSVPVFDNWYRPLDPYIVVDPREMLPTIPWQTGEIHIRREPVTVRIASSESRIEAI